jgi:hypothetical protein
MPRKYNPKQLQAMRQGELPDHRKWARQTFAWLQKKREQLERDRGNYSPAYYHQQVRELRETARHNLTFTKESLHTVVEPVLAERELHGLESYLIDWRQDPTDPRDTSHEAQQTRLMAEVRHGIRELGLLACVKNLDDDALIDRATFATRTRDPQLAALCLEEARARQSAGTQLQVGSAVKGLLETMPELQEAEEFFAETADLMSEFDNYLTLVDDPRNEYASAAVKAREVRESRQAREFVQQVERDDAARKRHEAEQKAAQQRAEAFRKEVEAEAKREEAAKKANGKEPELPPAA